jgi:hypothetical protein
LGYWLPDMPSLIRVFVQSSTILATYTGVILALGLDPEDRMLLARLRQRAKPLRGRHVSL